MTTDEKSYISTSLHPQLSILFLPNLPWEEHQAQIWPWEIWVPTFTRVSPESNGSSNWGTARCRDTHASSHSFSPWCLLAAAVVSTFFGAILNRLEKLTQKKRPPKDPKGGWKFRIRSERLLGREAKTIPDKQIYYFHGFKHRGEPPSIGASPTRRLDNINAERRGEQVRSMCFHTRVVY